MPPSFPPFLLLAVMPPVVMPANLFRPASVTMWGSSTSPLLTLRGGAETIMPDHHAGDEKQITPAFVQHRLAVLARAQARASAAAAGAILSPIVVTLPDGTTVRGEAGVTSPSTVANGISKQLASSSVVALVDDELWDMNRPLARSCALKLLPFDDPRAQQVFWHSSAHILGQALELHRGALLVTGDK